MLLGFWIDSWDLSTLHTVAALIGAALSLYVAQMWSRGEIRIEHPAVLIARRGALLMLALAMLWLVSYANDKGWAPWPAQVMLVLAVDLGLLVTIVATRVRQAATAH